MAPARRNLYSIFRWPLAIGIASSFGLMAALVADGNWDVLAALSLLLPTALTCWFVLRPDHRRPADSRTFSDVGEADRRVSRDRAGSITS
jgi:hypothetical protein